MNCSMTLTNSAAPQESVIEKYSMSISSNMQKLNLSSVIGVSRHSLFNPNDLESVVKVAGEVYPFITNNHLTVVLGTSGIGKTNLMIGMMQYNANQSIMYGSNEYNHAAITKKIVFASHPNLLKLSEEDLKAALKQNPNLIDDIKHVKIAEAGSFRCTLDIIEKIRNECGEQIGGSEKKVVFIEQLDCNGSREIYLNDLEVLRTFAETYNLHIIVGALVSQSGLVNRPTNYPKTDLRNLKFADTVVSMEQFTSPESNGMERAPNSHVKIYENKALKGSGKNTPNCQLGKKIDGEYLPEVGTRIWAIVTGHEPKIYEVRNYTTSKVLLVDVDNKKLNAHIGSTRNVKFYPEVPLEQDHYYAIVQKEWDDNTMADDISIEEVAFALSPEEAIKLRKEMTVKTLYENYRVSITLNMC